MKTNVSKKILEYTAVFEPAEEGGYVVSVPALPGCATEGDTFEEAVKMIKDAIKGYVTVLREENQEIPQEQSDIVFAKISINNPIAYL